MFGWLDRLTGRRALVHEVERLRLENRRLLETESSGSALYTITGLTDQVIQLDGALNVEYVNSAIALELGGSKESFRGVPLAVVDRLPWGPGILGPLVEQARAQGRAETERSHQRPDGREIFHRITVHHEDGGRGGRTQLRIEDITHLRNLERIFARYVSPKVVEKMKQLTERDFFRAERMELSILFADLRGFTSVAQKLPAVEVRHTINEYLEAMIGVADRHEAFVDKVVADEVMLLFGAPMADPHHAAHSIDVGLEMLDAQRELNRRWRDAGRPELGLGVGINTGEAVVGNIGSSTRADYTVIGHAVNVASRLCNKAGPGELLVSGETHSAYVASGRALARPVEFTAVGAIDLKGVSEPVPVLLARPR